ncbi:MAG: hypothetical protein ACFCU7_13090 [Pleurocapsa sp.]
MRYSIMLQMVGIITLILVGTAGLFAWLQNRDIPSTELETKRSGNHYSSIQ